MGVKDREVEFAQRWARWYRDQDFNPLPSRSDRKAPAMRSYIRERDHGLSEELLDHWWTRNIQLVCGARWGLVVVDLDGPAALAHWESLVRGWEPGGSLETWVVVTRNSDGSERGRHLWFDPRGESVPTRQVWGEWDEAAGRWRQRCSIEVKGEKSLIVAPPSRHPATGMRYKFLPGSSPRDWPEPAPLPAWVRHWPALRPPRPVSVLPLAQTQPRRSVLSFRCRRDPWVVLHAIPDKVTLAQAWGLQVVGQPNAAGWLRCRCLDRPDNHPSASFHQGTGYYSEPDGGGSSVHTYSLFDLGALIGPYATWQDCLDDLALAHHVHPQETHRVG